MTNRPTGVTILAILLIIGALLSLSGALGSIAVYGILYGGYSIAMGVINLLLGYGLWTMQPWARQWAIIFQIIGIVVSILMIIAFNVILPGFAMLLILALAPSLIISLIVIFYLNQSSIKAAFESAGETEMW